MSGFSFNGKDADPPADAGGTIIIEIHGDKSDERRRITWRAVPHKPPPANAGHPLDGGVTGQFHVQVEKEPALPPQMERTTISGPDDFSIVIYSPPEPLTEGGARPYISLWRPKDGTTVTRSSKWYITPEEQHAAEREIASWGLPRRT
jgi:hypothetical protein